MALQTGTKHYFGSFDDTAERFQNPNIAEELSVPFKAGGSTTPQLHPFNRENSEYIGGSGSAVAMDRNFLDFICFFFVEKFYIIVCWNPPSPRVDATPMDIIMDPLLSSVIGPDYLTEHQSLSGRRYCLNNGNTYICVVLNQNCLIFGHLDTFDVDLFLFFAKFHSWVKKNLENVSTIYITIYNILTCYKYFSGISTETSFDKFLL